MKTTEHTKKKYYTPECIMITHPSEGLLNASFIEVKKDDDDIFEGEFSAKKQDFTEFEPWSDLSWNIENP